MSSRCQCGAPLGGPGAAKAAGDVTILAALVILSMILIVTFSTAAVIRYLRVVVDAAGRAAPPAGYAAWRGAQPGVRRRTAGGP